jgi:hypothetical protein
MSKSGESFERLVAEIQGRIDPTAKVTHNEFLIDRLGHRRQFDVVIRGNFAGQEMLGVIECKDFKGRVGTPVMDAFNTKAQDINANFKIIASRRGFTKPSLEKAKHYGIKAVSLVDPDSLDQSFALGDWWTAKVFRWSQIHISAHPADSTLAAPEVSPEQLIVKQARVLDWFTNLLLKEGHGAGSLGWVVNFQLQFDPPIEVCYAPDQSIPCKALSFHAERACLEYERYVQVSAEAFVDWHTRAVTIPANTQLRTPNIPTDFRQWEPRDPLKERTSCFLPVAIEAHEHQFNRVENVPDFESM